MEKVFLSKSKYKRGLKCKKILWLDKYKKNLSEDNKNRAVLKRGNEVGELAKGLFGDYEDVEYNDKKSIMIKKTNELMLNKPNIITEASFSYDNNFCSVDILKNDIDGVEFYEVKSSNSVKEDHLIDAAYQYYVLDNLGLNVKKVGIVHLDGNYRRGKELDINKLFHIEDITGEVKEQQDEVKNKIYEIKKFMAEYDGSNEPDIKISGDCCKSYLCNYWKYCRGDVPRPNVFDVPRLKKEKMFDKFHEGVISFEDLYNDEGFKELSPNQQFIIEFFVENKEPDINRKEIAEFYEKLKYPLYFVDYESINPPIPEYEGAYPSQPICFQYSLHIIDENGNCEHKEFLADVDDENIPRTFAEKLARDIPPAKKGEHGSVIVFNKTFEHTRNKELGEMYVDLEEDMKRINDNIVDFMIPFSNKSYYTKEMLGSTKLKVITPILYPELDYSNLKLIHNATEASEGYSRLKNGTLTEKEQEEIKENLKRYCERDTYTLVKMWKTFKKIARINNSIS